jgi:hypothetical protein
VTGVQTWCSSDLVDGKVKLAVILGEREGGRWRYKITAYDVGLELLIAKDGRGGERGELDCIKMQKIDAIVASMLRRELGENIEEAARFVGTVGFTIPEDRYEPGVGLRVDVE